MFRKDGSREFRQNETLATATEGTHKRSYRLIEWLTVGLTGRLDCRLIDEIDIGGATEHGLTTTARKVNSRIKSDTTMNWIEERKRRWKKTEDKEGG